MAEQKSFSEQMRELETIKQKFESGNFDLEKDLPLYRRAIELARSLKTHLGQLENEIIEIEKKKEEQP